MEYINYYVKNVIIPLENETKNLRLKIENSNSADSKPYKNLLKKTEKLLYEKYIHMDEMIAEEIDLYNKISK